MANRITPIPDAGHHELWKPTGLVPAVVDNQKGFFFLEELTRERASDDREYFVRLDGDDANTGRQDNLFGAWRTPQRAADYLSQSVDFNARQITVTIRAGSFSGVYNKSYTGGGRLYWRGNKLVPSQVILGNVFNPDGFEIGAMNLLTRTATEVFFNGFRFAPNNRPAIDADPLTCGEAFLTLSDVDPEGGAYTAAMEIAGNQANSTPIFGNFFDGGFVDGGISMLIDGAALTSPAALMHTLARGQIFLGSTIQITGNPTFSIATLISSTGGYISDFATWSGSAVGPRFFGAPTSLLQLGNGLTGIPGTLPGILQADAVAQYTGSDGVFFGTFRDRHYVTNITGGTTNLTNNDSGRIFENTGAGSLSILNLPECQQDTEITMIVLNANGWRAVAKAGDTIRVEGSVSASGGRVDSTTVGSVIKLRGSDSSQWVAEYFTGTWTPT